MPMAYSWFRVYTGTVNDKKWPRIARDAGQPVGCVVSVWLALLESASSNIDRGAVDDFCPEDIDALYGYDDGTTESIVHAMRDRGLISPENRLTAWDKRQNIPTEDAPEDRRAYKREWARRKREESRIADSPASGQPVDSCRHDVDTSGQPVDSCRHHKEKIREDKIRDLKYTLLTPQGVGGCEASQQEDQHTHMPETPERRTVNTGLPSRGGANASWWKEFTSLWDIWPNRQGKDAAWCVYCDFRRRKLDMPPLYVLRDKASAMIAQDRKFLAGYVPELKTWLREHRWNDEPCPPRDVAVPGRGRTSREQQMATDVERAAEAARRFEDFFEMAADEPAAEGVFA